MACRYGGKLLEPLSPTSPLRSMAYGSHYHTNSQKRCLNHQRSKHLSLLNKPLQPDSIREWSFIIIVVVVDIFMVLEADWAQLDGTLPGPSCGCGQQWLGQEKL